MGFETELVAVPAALAGLLPKQWTRLPTTTTTPFAPAQPPTPISYSSSLFQLDTFDMSEGAGTGAGTGGGTGGAPPGQPPSPPPPQHPSVTALSSAAAAANSIPRYRFASSDSALFVDYSDTAPANDDDYVNPVLNAPPSASAMAVPRFRMESEMGPPFGGLAAAITPQSEIPIPVTATAASQDLDLGTAPGWVAGGGQPATTSTAPLTGMAPNNMHAMTPMQPFSMMPGTRPPSMVGGHQPFEDLAYWAGQQQQLPPLHQQFQHQHQHQQQQHQYAPAPTQFSYYGGGGGSGGSGDFSLSSAMSAHAYPNPMQAAAAAQHYPYGGAKQSFSNHSEAPTASTESTAVSLNHHVSAVANHAPSAHPPPPRSASNNKPNKPNSNKSNNKKEPARRSTRPRATVSRAPSPESSEFDLDDNDNQPTPPAPKRRRATPSSSSQSQQQQQTNITRTPSATLELSGTIGEGADQIAPKVFASISRSLFQLQPDQLSPDQSQSVIQHVLAKRERNTEAARRSRGRRKEHLEYLEGRVNELERENGELRERLEVMGRELERRG